MDALEYKNGLPNKMIDENGNIKTISGDTILKAVPEYEAKKALPNKFINPDGSYSTLNEILASVVDTDLFEVVAKLPDKGNPKKIYLVPNGKGTFDEYHYHNGKWDPIGTLDISNLVTTEQLQQALQQAKDYTDKQIDSKVTQVLGGDY